MLLLQVFLLVMLIRGSFGEDVPVECKQMKCFVPPGCTRRTSSTFLEILDGDLISDTCDAIVKIRSYSEKYYLIVLQSYDRMLSIKLEQGATIFECSKPSPNGKVTAKYNNKEVTLIRQESTKIMCEFIVKSDSNVFDDPGAEVKLSHSLLPSGITTTGQKFHVNYAAPTCDPDAVQPKNDGVVVDKKTVFRFDVKLADLECPVGRTLTFRNGVSGNFAEPPNNIITCNDDKHKFEPELTEARCEVTTCDQCHLNTLGAKGFETFVEGGCPKLKCKNGTRVKFDGSNPVEGIGECKFETNKHVWKLNEKTIDDSTKVECAEKLKCFSSQEDVNKACENCGLGSNNLPNCTSPTAVLKWDGILKMDVLCDDITGEYTFNDVAGGNTIIGKTSKKKLKCVDDKAVAAEESEQKAAEAAQMLTIVGSVIGGVLGLAAVVGIVVFFVIRKKKKKAKKDEEEDEKKWRMKNALEEAKEKEKKSEMKQLEEIRLRQANGTGGQTEVLDDETRFGGDTAPKPKSDWMKALEAQQKKNKRKDDTAVTETGQLPGETDATGVDAEVIMAGTTGC